MKESLQMLSMARRQTAYIGRQQLRADRVYASGTLFRNLYCSTEFVKDEICPSDCTCRKVSMSQKREKTRKGYDYVLIDTPPMLSMSDASIVAKQCDGQFLLFRMKQSAEKMH